jgi:branched-chain amino acid transport system substrate-binding protein
MKKLLSLALAVLPLILDTAVSAESQELKLGSISILQGEGASWGTAAKNGVVMAVDALNAQDGVLGRKVVVEFQDDQGDPKKTISAFRQLTDVSNIQFIIGPTWSRSGLALIDLVDRKKVLMISPSLGMAKFNESSEFLFNTWQHDSISSAMLADYVFGKGHRRIALVGAEDPWVKEQTEAFRSRFVELGGTILFQTEPLPGSTDLRTDALRILKTPGIEAVVSTTDGVIVGSLVAKALKELSFGKPIYSVTVDQSAIDAAQGGFEGMEYLSFLTPTAQFRTDYESRFGIPIDIGADSAYDAVMMLAQSIREAASFDPAVVAKELARIKSYEGVSGALKSDGKRGFLKPSYKIQRVVAGKSVDVGR